MSIKIFYCYAREDKALRATLEKHLGNLKRQELITGWSDRNIDAGKEWAKEIDCNLKTANVILLLISPDFVHSEYCYSIEMMQALERHEKGTARVVPIILRHVEYEGAPFSRLQALPTGAVPVTDRKWRNRDEAFFDVAEGIRKAAEEIAVKLSVNPPVISLQVATPSLVVREPKSTKSRKHQYKPGDKVHHFQFGKGIILKSELKQGAEFVEVQFQGIQGKRRMNLQIVRLEKL